MNIQTIAALFEQTASAFPEKSAFVERDGDLRSFGELLTHSRFFGAELVRLGMEGRPAAIVGEVDYGGLCAMLGCQLAGCPLIPLSSALAENELCSLLSEYEAGAVFVSPKFAELGLAVERRLPELTVITDPGRRLSRESTYSETQLPDVDPGAPAFLFRNGEGAAAMISHQNICSALAAIASTADIGSYTFLCPVYWGGAFDCTMGLLLPLLSGCTLIRRREKRGVSRAIAESEATALTCTPQRLRNLERSLRFRSEQNLSKTAIAMYNALDRLSHIPLLDLSKRMRRRVRRLMGDKLQLILCGGGYPEWDSARRFSDWGIEVRTYYFTPECGPLAVGDSSGKKLLPLAELTVPSPIYGELGELCVTGDRIPIGYYNGRADFPNGFPTGDMGLLAEDGTLELRGRRKTMLCGRDGEPLFPEELAQIIKRNRYVSDCVITGRFDTKTSDVILTARITPDLREVRAVIGEKYSDNRLRLFFQRIMEKLEPELPRKINEFKVVG